MRISELAKKYGLSSLKVQKLLVTAGVYKPVKKDANYDLVKSLYEAGKSMSEIADETQLSKATINGFLPYERSMKNAEAFNIDVSSAADRKRKQRDKESRRKGYLRSALTSSLSEDDLWDALAAHEHDSFIATTGQKFSIKVTPSYPKPTYEPHYYFSPRSTTENELIITSEGDKLYISKEELYNAFYWALEIKADCMDPGGPRSHEVHTDSHSDINDALGVHDKYLRPLFNFLGILPGDIDKTTTKRVVSEVRKCSCCGKETPELYNVTSFEDLIKLDARFKADRAAALTENHGSEDRYADPVLQKMQLYYADKKKETLEKARASKPVKAFNSEGIRSLCKLCAETIYMALEEGEMPVSPSRSGYDNMPSKVLHDYIISNTETADCDYYQVLFGKFHAYEFDNKNMLLFTAVDKESIAHYFALTVTKYPLEETNIGIGFRGLEVHKLTRAGRIAANSTATDYDIYHFRLCHDGDDYQKTVYIGVIELMDKIASILNTQTLHESHFPADNLITIDGRHYGINSIGTIIPVYVENSKNYRSMKDRKGGAGMENHNFICCFSGNLHGVVRIL